MTNDPALSDPVWSMGVEDVARSLLGWEITDGGVTVRLTEVEAYAGVGVDPASHAYRGETPRNAAMFGPPGHAYVYFVYGAHWCLNVVCAQPGVAAAVLLRAGQVTAGLGTARSRRATLGGVAGRDLARGPGRLATVLGVDRSVNGTRLIGGAGPITLRRPGETSSDAGSATPPREIRVGPRVGVRHGAQTPWRFWLAGEPTVSAYRRPR